MTLYTPFPGEQSLLPPGVLERTHFFYFVLDADDQQLQAFCDRTLNQPSQGAVDYRSKGFVLLAFTHVESLTSSDPDQGPIAYKDIALWVPVHGGATGAPAHWCLFPPVILVDSASTMVAGREIFGLPKQLGRFKMPLTPNEVDEMSSSSPAFRAEVVGSVTQGDRQDWRTLLTVEVKGGGHDLPTPHETGPGLVDLIRNVLGMGPTHGIDIPGWLGTAHTLGLKQFRDIIDPKRSCYAAIVEAPLAMATLHGVPRLYLNHFVADLHALASHRLDQLGLPRGRQPVRLGVYFNATMNMGPGREVWRG